MGSAGSWMVGHSLVFGLAPRSSSIRCQKYSSFATFLLASDKRAEVADCDMRKTKRNGH